MAGKRMSPKSMSSSRSIAGAGYEEAQMPKAKPVMYKGDGDSQGSGKLKKLAGKPYRNEVKKGGK